MVAYNNSNNTCNYKINSCNSNNNNNLCLYNKTTTNEGFSVGGAGATISEMDQQTLPPPSRLTTTSNGVSTTITDASSNTTEDSFSFSFISALLGLH